MLASPAKEEAKALSTLSLRTLAAGVGGGRLPCALAMDGALVEFARDTLGSRDKGGMETVGDAFRDRHLREKDGIRDAALDARPLSGDGSGRCRFARGLSKVASLMSSKMRITSGSSKLHSCCESRGWNSGSAERKSQPAVRKPCDATDTSGKRVLHVA